MRSSRPKHGRRIRVVVTVCAVLLFARIGWAQSRPPREHVVLPPATAGTPLSAQIQAEAEYLAARGDLIESVAVARKIHADAFAKEIENSIGYVDAYFKRREVYRQWRAKENPNHFEQEKKLQEIRRERIEKQFQDVLKGDLTGQLNWLLVELSGPTLALHYVAGKVSMSETNQTETAVDGTYVGGEIPMDDSKTGRAITSADAAMIRFSDGRVTFTAADPQLLQAHWPWALRATEFDPLRAEFSAARDLVMQNIQSQGEVQYASGERLVKSLNALLVALEATYPSEKRRDMPTFVRYHAAKRYLRTLATESQSAIQAGDRSLAGDAVRFDGGSVVALIRHMDRTGLAFAPPPPGGERVYRSLLTSMRSLYLTWGQQANPVVREIRSTSPGRS